MKVLDKDGLTYYTGKVKSTLTNYVQFTDYATDSKGGVVKVGNSTSVDSNGVLNCATRDYTTYSSMNNKNFISKGTLENVITGKGLVSNTDYATNSKGGVVKVYSSYATAINNTTGALTSQVKTYTDYTNGNDTMFISKGTLENVLTARIGDIETILTTIDIGSGAVEVL